MGADKTGKIENINSTSVQMEASSTSNVFENQQIYSDTAGDQCFIFTLGMNAKMNMNRVKKVLFD
ncbi:MAG: hypothetical protein PVI71_17590 [Desulfobacterales bacterium]|jgi:hypothetical protein